MGRPRNTPEQAAATRERRRLREKERRSRMCENGVTVGAMASCERRRDPEVRAREAARRRERYREKMELARAVEKFALRATERSSRVKSASAAQCASSKTWPSLSAGKCDSQAQCVVPLMFKSSQTKTVLISAEVQTRATRKKPAAGLRNRPGAESVSASDSGTRKTGVRSLTAGKCDSETQCVVLLTFKSSQAALRAKLRSVEVQTEDTRKMRAGDHQLSGGHHFEVP